LGTLAAGIANEINNPLNHVYALIKPLRIMTRNIGNKKKQKKIDTALFAMKDCLEMTFSIIHSLKSFTGINQSEVKEIKLIQSINHILTILKSKTRNIKININVPENLSIIGNNVSLNQVMMNLIANSCDAIPDDKIGRIDITAYQKNSRVYLQVKDNGTGISKDHQEKIFDPFFTTKEVGHGMGLGLHVCQIEINKIGGNISFTSAKDQGTKFEIALPKEYELRKSA
ncbi:MAG: sensor histidine kinase, partial [Oligoflexales bacterium]